MEKKINKIIERVLKANCVAWGWEPGQYQGKDQLLVLIDPSGIDGEGQLGVACPASYGEKNELIKLIEEIDPGVWINLEIG